MRYAVEPFEHAGSRTRPDAMFLRLDDLIDWRLEALKSESAAARRILEPFLAHLRSAVPADGFADLQQKWLRPGSLGAPGELPQMLKFFDLLWWFEGKLRICRRLGLDRAAPSDIVDIGAGPAHFGFLARYFGHRVVATDLAPAKSDSVLEMYADFRALFGIPWQAHASTVGAPLPDFGRRFDLATGLLTKFHVHADGSAWGVDDWDRFLSNLAQQLNEQARIFFQLNEAHITPETWDFLSRRARWTQAAGRQIELPAWPDAGQADGRPAGKGHDGPGFLCIGQQKAGTTWLYHQLGQHPQFWMSPIKEFHFFDHRLDRHARIADSPWLVRGAAELEKMRKGQAARGLRPFDDDDLAQMRLMAELARAPAADVDGYARLFAFKPGLVSGDITPTYTALDDAAIAAIRARFPGLKIVLNVREPIERAWSQINMLDREERFDRALLDSPNKFAKFLKRETFATRSFASAIARRWQNVFGTSFKVIPFDDIVASPGETRDAVVAFLGAEPCALSIPADLNLGGNHAPKLAMSEPIRAKLVEHFAEELRAAALLFGGAAREWPARYGLS